MSYLIGSVLPFGHLFENAAGSATDPTVVTFTLVEGIDGTELVWTYTTSGAVTTSPDGFSTVITRTSAGLFALSHTARKPERHTGVWRGTGSVVNPKQETFLVRHSGSTFNDVF